MAIMKCTENGENSPNPDLYLNEPWAKESHQYPYLSLSIPIKKKKNKNNK